MGTTAVEAGEIQRSVDGPKRAHQQTGKTRCRADDVDEKFQLVHAAEKDAWELLPGDYRIGVGTLSRDLPPSARVAIGK